MVLVYLRGSSYILPKQGEIAHANPVSQVSTANIINMNSPIMYDCYPKYLYAAFILNHINLVYIITPYVLGIHFNIIPPFMGRYSKKSLSFKFFDQHFILISDAQPFHLSF